METVQFNSVTVGWRPIKSAASNSTAQKLFTIGSVDAFSGEGLIVREATAARLWRNSSTIPTLIAYSDQIEEILHTSIRSFPGEPYSLRRPIPVAVQQIGQGDHLAIFDEANIASSGANRKEAYQNLAVEILNIFEKFTEEKKNLGPEPTRQLKLLRRYIVRHR